MNRLMKLAQAALVHYPIYVQVVQSLVMSTNALFRVTDKTGTAFVLRVCAPGEHDWRDHAAEALWLDALARDGAVSVPHLVHTHNGDVSARASAPGVPEPRDCMVFSWVPGKPIEDAAAETPEVFEAFGELSAQLHQHAATLQVPEDLQPMRWDKAFYYAHEPVVVYAPSHAHLFTEIQIEQIKQAQCRVDIALTELFTKNVDGPMLIHGDLTSGNVHIHDSMLYALDFEDLMWGFPVQDIAVTLYRVRRNADYTALRTAFQRGYERVRPWPFATEGQLETLFTARLLMFINYCANKHDDPDMAAWIPKLLARLD